MALDKAQIEQELAEALSAISKAANLDELKQIKIDFVGDKSPLAKANQALGSLEATQRAEFGKLIGQARASVNSAFESKSNDLSDKRDLIALQTEKVYVSIPVRRALKVGLHPLTILTN